MKKKKSYMHNKNVLSESFIDNLLKQLVPGLHKRAEERYLKKKSKQLNRLETEMEKSVSKLNGIKKEIERGWEEATGEKIKFDDLSIEDILSRYK